MGKLFWRPRSTSNTHRPADPSEEFDIVAGCYPTPLPIKDGPAQLPYDLDDVRAHLRMAWESLLTTLHRYPEGVRMCQMLDTALAQHVNRNDCPTYEGYEAMLRVFIRAESYTLNQISGLSEAERHTYTVATFAWRDVKHSDAVCTAREALLLLDAWRVQHTRKV